MKIIITEEQKKKLFIPRKLSSGNSRYTEWNNSQPIRDGVRINQYTPDGLKIGYWEEYHDNGKLGSKGNYVKGDRDGYWEWYYENGRIESKGSYKNGKRDDYWEDYWDNGKLMFRGYYVDGKRNGYWEFYYSNGQISRKGYYKNGELIED
jgi:antitoxin component YwqK of YwqJK toxin-antitoxin module